LRRLFDRRCEAVANLVPATAKLVNRVVTGGLVGDAPMFQPSNVDQAQGMQAASVVMMVSPLAEAGAAAAVEAVGMGARVEAGATAVPTGVQANKAVGIEGRGLLCQLLPALDDDIRDQRGGQIHAGGAPG